mgnify:CR=1 FL=1
MELKDNVYYREKTWLRIATNGIRGQDYDDVIAPLQMKRGGWKDVPILEDSITLSRFESNTIKAFDKTLCFRIDLTEAPAQDYKGEVVVQYLRPGQGDDPVNCHTHPDDPACDPDDGPRDDDDDTGDGDPPLPFPKGSLAWMISTNGLAFNFAAGFIFQKIVPATFVSTLTTGLISISMAKRWWTMMASMPPASGMGRSTYQPGPTISSWIIIKGPATT